MTKNVQCRNGYVNHWEAQNRGLYKFLKSTGESFQNSYEKE